MTETLFETAGGRPAIERLVRAFYVRTRLDARLGPVFAAAARDDPEAWWAAHQEKLVDFWTSVAGGPPRYHGRPAPAHHGLGIRSEHFDAWLALWRETLDETLPAPAAEDFYVRAARMREHLERHLAGTPGPRPAGRAADQGASA